MKKLLEISAVLLVFAMYSGGASAQNGCTRIIQNGTVANGSPVVWVAPCTLQQGGGSNGSTIVNGLPMITDLGVMGPLGVLDAPINGPYHKALLSWNSNAFTINLSSIGGAGTPTLVCTINGVSQNCLSSLTGLPSVSSNSALQSLNPSASTVAYRAGYYAAGDGGDASYVYSASACSLNSGAGDNGSQVQALGGGCWNISPQPIYDIRIWGAKCNGVFDDTAAANLAAAFSSALRTLDSCSFVGPFTSTWAAFGSPKLVVGGVNSASNSQNGILGYILNSETPSSASLPAGVNGWGKITAGSNGNAGFGVYGLGELFATGGGVAVGAEFTARNFSGNNPDVGLPPSTGFGTTTSVATGENVTCGVETNTKDCSIGIYIANESGQAANPVFNTGEFISLYRQYGLFINAMPSGTQTSEVVQNNGNGVNLQLQFTNAISPSNSVFTVTDNNSASRASIRQNGDIYNTGHLLFDQVLTGSRPTVTACGSGPSINRSNDQAGTITVGSGTVTSCTVNFATAFQQVPACTVSGENGMSTSSPLLIGTKSASLITVTSGSANMAGFNFDYTCFDQL